jgi:hypothetical protein
MTIVAGENDPEEALGIQAAPSAASVGNKPWYFFFQPKQVASRGEFKRTGR